MSARYQLNEVQLTISTPALASRPLPGIRAVDVGRLKASKVVDDMTLLRACCLESRDDAEDEEPPNREEKKEGMVCLPRA